MLNVDSGTTGSTVTEREIQDVPLVNRSVLDLAMTLPNVSGDRGQRESGDRQCDHLSRLQHQRQRRTSPEYR